MRGIIEKIDKTINKIKDNNLSVLFFFTILSLLFFFVTPYPKHPDMFFYIEGAKVIKQGGLIYKDFGDVKPILIFYLYYLILSIFTEKNIFLGLKILSFLFQIFNSFFFWKISNTIFKNKKISLYLSLLLLFSFNIGTTTWYPNIFLFYMLPLFISILFITKNNFQISNTLLFISGLFLGIAILFSMNMIFYSILFLVILFYKHKEPKYIVTKTIFFIIGIIIPSTILITFYYHKNALNDFIWWNFKWSSIYGNYYPLWLRIWKFFYNYIITWYFIPTYFFGVLGIYKLIKSKEEINNIQKLFLILILFTSILSRLSLCKATERYMLYIIPFFILLIPYGFSFLLYQKSRFKKIIFSISAFILILGFSINTKIKYSESKIWDQNIEKNRLLYKYTKDNSKPDEKIFVFNKGGHEFIYFYSERKIATSFLLPGQHLDYLYLWEQIDYKNIEEPWEKFLKEFEENKPVLVIDPTGGFSPEKKSERKGKLKEYMEKFENIVYQNYYKDLCYDNIIIWKRK